MAFIPTVNAIKLVIEGTVQGQKVIVTISVGKGSTVTPTDLINATDAIEDWWVAEVLPSLSAAYDGDVITAYDLSSEFAPTYSNPYTDVGGLAVPPIANNTALVTSFRTAGRGRSARGRNYVPCMPNNIGGPTATTSGQAADIAAAYAAMSDYLDPVGLEHIVISNYTGGAARTSGLKQPVTAYITNIEYDSQRSRLEGRGI